MIQEARGHELQKERGQTHVRGWKEKRKRENYTIYFNFIQ